MHFGCIIHTGIHQSCGKPYQNRPVQPPYQKKMKIAILEKLVVFEENLVDFKENLVNFNFHGYVLIFSHFIF